MVHIFNEDDVKHLQHAFPFSTKTYDNYIHLLTSSVLSVCPPASKLRLIFMSKTFSEYLSQLINGAVVAVIVWSTHCNKAMSETLGMFIIWFCVFVWWRWMPLSRILNISVIMWRSVLLVEEKFAFYYIQIYPVSEGYLRKIPVSRTFDCPRNRYFSQKKPH
jgi:hypothetical protein